MYNRIGKGNCILDTKGEVMKKLVIDIYDSENGVLDGVVEINSKDLELLYFNGNKLKGLQSNYSEDDEAYKRQVEICSKIVELVKQLESIS